VYWVLGDMGLARFVRDTELASLWLSSGTLATTTVTLRVRLRSKRIHGRGSSRWV
jgi:hypothetical protein